MKEVCHICGELAHVFAQDQDGGNRRTLCIEHAVEEIMED